MADKISVIVPVYNVAAYLPQCLDSILSQDHQDLEVIVIDDGSTDASGGICDRYAGQDPRVRVIHQKNAGAAAAKNAGLRAATGEYLSFVDSDDYLQPHVYGHMLGLLKETGADAAQFSFQEVYVSRQEVQPVPFSGEMDSRDYLVQFTQGWTCALLWNKLYRRGIFDGVFFEEGHKIDDEYFTYQGFLKPRKIVFSDRVIYNYRRRRSSVMASPAAAEQRLLDCLDAVAKRREKVCQAWPELKKPFDVNYLDTLCYLSENGNATRRLLEELKAHLRAYLRQGGNTFPPRYYWKKLLQLHCIPIEKRLASLVPGGNEYSMAEDCFP